MSVQGDPKVGIGVMIVRGEAVLGGRRHLEFGESFEECAAREVLEETGLHIDDIDILHVSNCVHMEANKHYVTIIMSASVPKDAEPENLEPEKCQGWEWRRWDDLPSPLFMGLQKLVDSGYRLPGR